MMPDTSHPLEERTAPATWSIRSLQRRTFRFLQDRPKKVDISGDRLISVAIIYLIVLSLYLYLYQIYQSPSETNTWRTWRWNIREPDGGFRVEIIYKWGDFPANIY